MKYANCGRYMEILDILSQVTTWNEEAIPMSWHTFIISGLRNLSKEREVLTFIPLTLSSRHLFIITEFPCFLPLATFSRVFFFFYRAHLKR